MQFLFGHRSTNLRTDIHNHNIKQNYYCHTCPTRGESPNILLCRFREFPVRMRKYFIAFGKFRIIYSFLYFKRIKLSKPLVDDFYEVVSGWDGYTFRVGKNGTQPFSVKLEFVAATLVDRLESELTRLCKELGPRIDKALAALDLAGSGTGSRS